MKMILVLSCFAAVCIALASSEFVEPMYLDYLFSHDRKDEAYALLGLSDSIFTDNVTTNYGKYNPALYQGDILLRKEQARQATDFGVYPSLKWDRIVPYYISPDFIDRHKQLIQRSVERFNTYFSDCLKWTEWTPQDRNYVYFYPGEGCNSCLGRCGGQQILNLDPNGCMDTGTILHEMDHACGMHHEHQRTDRDNHIKVLYDNLRQEWKMWWNIEHDMYIAGNYEIMSIMHYDMYNSGVTTEPWMRTFEILHNPDSYDESKIGRVQDFSEIDKKKLRHMYSC